MDRYEKFETIEIDEKREKYDLSDHCMVMFSLKMKKNKKKKKRNTDYHRVDRINRYEKELMERTTKNRRNNNK